MICSAEAPPRELFCIRPGQNGFISDEERYLMDELSLDSSVSRAFFDNEEELFACQRALSRLIEMQTDLYKPRHHPYMTTTETIN